MTKTELSAMTVAELKALAKKKKVSLPPQGKKADIVTALLASERIKKPAVKERIAATKRAVKKVKTVTKMASRKSVLTRKPATIETPVVREPIVTTRPHPASGKAVKVTVPKHEWKIAPEVEESLLAQERVSESKYYTGPAMRELMAADGELPKGYGEDKIVLMMRDPFVAYVYWEATQAHIERERAWFGWGSKLCLRIYDVTGVQFDGRNAIGYFDQEIVDRTGNWYFDLGRPSHSFCADLGLLAPEGRFLTLARSNHITMPLDTVSDEIDEEWMLADEEFWKLYGYPEGMRSGLSSPQLEEMVRRRRLLEISSPGLFPRERQKRKQKQKS